MLPFLAWSSSQHNMSSGAPGPTDADKYTGFLMYLGFKMVILGAEWIECHGQDLEGLS